MSLPAIVVGTTNRDEGAYIGFFGKASDGMVDVQVISDIHKSEVYRMAKLLDIPASIHQAIPSGDMYDGRVDEEVFGATYDFVELYQHYLCLNSPETKHHFKAALSEEAASQFELLSSRIESMHNYNRHKYLGKNPSVHLDIYERFVPGGWMD
jgi:NAD+ synthase (glutamine-hydrolysing)